MNKIKARVTDIQSMNNLSIVAFEAGKHSMQMMALGLNIPVEIGSSVILGAKASNVSIAADMSTMISISNQLSCIVEELNKGELLCSVKLRFNSTIIESIITMKSILKMDIKVGDNITALIKASELSILKVEGVK